jgi:hypothetical protein
MKVCGVNDHVPLSRKTEKMKKKEKKTFHSIHVWFKYRKWLQGL